MPLCNLCPRRCNTDRSTPEGLRRSLCGAPLTPKVALVSLHLWEEPCLTGTAGAGTVFFSHCNLRCCFCQNRTISAGGDGIEITTERLRDIFLEQQARGAACIDLVTPTQYTDFILPALRDARARGLSLPVVYNTNGYDLPETIERYRGLVNIYMPDMKYMDSRLGARYSGVPHYAESAKAAIETMVAQTGPVQFDAHGQLTRGVLIRHLVLPGQYADSLRVLDWIHETFADTVIVSLMNQYMPLYNAVRHPEINRPLLTLEYQKVMRHAEALGMTRVYIQKGRSALAKFIPVFDGRNVRASSCSL